MRKRLPNSKKFWKKCNGYHKIFIYWVTGDIAELCDVFFVSVEWKMRAAERETKQVPSALLQKFRLKINIAAYRGIAGAGSLKTRAFILSSCCWWWQPLLLVVMVAAAGGDGSCYGWSQRLLLAVMVAAAGGDGGWWWWWCWLLLMVCQVAVNLVLLPSCFFI